MNGKMRAEMDALLASANRLHHAIDNGLVVRIEDATAGIRASNVERSVSHGTNDPTGQAALGAHDPAEQHLVELANCVERALGNMRRALRIAQGYPEPRVMTEHSGHDDGCQSCEQVFIAEGVRRWEPPVVESSDVKGRLDRRMRLCQWCYGFVRDYERLPTIEELELHHRGKKLMRKAGS